MSQEFAFWHYPHDDTGGAQINGQFPLYDRGHIAEVPDAATRSRWSASSKASLILLFDPAAPEPIGSGTPNTGAFTTLSATGLTVASSFAALNLRNVGGAADENRTFFQMRNDGILFFGSESDAGVFGQTFMRANRSGNAWDWLSLDVSGSSAIYVNASRNVGINTTSPAAKLHVAGNARFTPSAASTVGISHLTGVAAPYIFMKRTVGDVENGDFAIFRNATDVSFGRFGVANDLKIDQTDGGVIVGDATGASKGAGTLNAVSVYDDNVLLTDLVLDYAEDGAWDREAYAAHPVDSLLQDWMLDPAQYAAAWKRDRHLPLLVSWQDEANRPALGQIVTRQTGELELHAVHIANHEARLAALEVRLAS